MVDTLANDKTNGIGVAAIAAGTLFAYGGIKGFSILKAVQNVVTGQSPNAGQTSTIPLASGASSGSSGSTGTPSGGGSVSQNEALAQQMAASKGWTGQQWTALKALWTTESGFSQYATNKSSGAYGIAQALPPTKYPQAGQKSGGSDPAVQIQWGLDYIETTYGDPITAEAHEQANGWY